MPDRTPLTTVKAQGTTDGTRIVTQGSPAGTLVTVVLPGGSFCQDTPLATDAKTTLRYYSLAGDGRVSTAVERMVTYDPTAPQPPLPTCSGEKPSECVAQESCGNDTDDDCNGWTDACDSACNGCQDDAFEPNDFPANVPSLLPGTYQMKLCPCRDDWYAFNVDMGSRIHAIIDFDSSLIDIDVRLYRAGPEGSGIGEQVDASAGTDSQEEIDWIADMPGAYYMRVFPFRDEDMPEGDYSITIN